MTIQELGPQIDQALFGHYGKITFGQRTYLILPRGVSRCVRIQNYGFVTQNHYESDICGHLARESVRIIWIEVDGKVRGDGYVNGRYVKSVVEACLEIASTKV